MMDHWEPGDPLYRPGQATYGRRLYDLLDDELTVRKFASWPDPVPVDDLDNHSILRGG